MFNKMPTIDKQTIRELLPKLINGRGTPVAGRNELATLILIKDCAPIEKVIPKASNLPNLSGHLVAIMQPRLTKAKKSPIKNKHPIKPNSSAQTENIKSV